MCMLRWMYGTLGQNFEWRYLEEGLLLELLMLRRCLRWLGDLKCRPEVGLVRRVQRGDYKDFRDRPTIVFHICIRSAFFLHRGSSYRSPYLFRYKTCPTFISVSRSINYINQPAHTNHNSTKQVTLKNTPSAYFYMQHFYFHTSICMSSTFNIFNYQQVITVKS